ncbi:MAG: Stp1/IreP family PP2C-type Ser/Thr phosphatase [Candidatus Promineifilaceae bacterium]
MLKIDKVTASLRTHVGRVRGHNEDFVASWEPSTDNERNGLGWLYIVADGVGGAEAGDVASQMATEQTISHYVDSEQEDSAERLLGAIQTANDDLRQLASERGQGGYMATTMCAALIQNGHAILANVGDSRGYFLRGGELTQITRDHSLVAQLVIEGAITAEEALTHPRRNVILSSLGPSRDPQIDLFNVEVTDGDRLLLCSDGLNRHVSDQEIAEIAQETPPEEATQTLLNLANERGGSDNISVAIVHLVMGESSGVLHPVVAIPDDEQQMNSALPMGLWAYTALLAVIEAALILAVYMWLSV